MLRAHHSVMLIETEVGHNQRGACNYYKSLAERVDRVTAEYFGKSFNSVYFCLVIITNSPRSLSNHIRKCQKCREELEKALRSQLIEGMTLFIVPVLLAKEMIPAIFVRAMGAVARVRPSIPSLDQY